MLRTKTNGLGGLIGNVAKAKNKNFWIGKRILITGGKGFVGRHVINYLRENRGVNFKQIFIPESSACDLREYSLTKKAMENIDIVIHLAADVGGIAYSSSHPATQMRNCLLVDSNVFEAAAEAKVKKMVCVSSAVAYPVNAPSPLREKDLFLGEPASSGYGYGFAKRMSVVMAKAFKEEKGLNSCVLLAANSYGPGQDFDLKTGHVIPSLIRKCLTEKELIVWGDGNQVRDFFYVKDFARAIVIATEKLSTHEPVNIGTGYGISIKKLVKIVAKATEFKGKVVFDTSKPTGQKKRVLSIELVKKLIDYKPQYSLQKGIQETVDWYKNNYLE